MSKSGDNIQSTRPRHERRQEGQPVLPLEAQSNMLTPECALQHDVMVTSGANQGFINIVLTLLDPNDAAILFVPYYFNHLMALQMTGGGHSVVFGRCHQQTWRPDLDWLEQVLAVPTPPKMVVLVNPCNPTGHSQIYTYDEQRRGHKSFFACHILSACNCCRATNSPVPSCLNVLH